MNLQEKFARNFRVMLAERQISKTKLSEETGISRTTISQISNGKTKMIKFETIEQIAKALEIEPYELFK